MQATDTFKKVTEEVVETGQPAVKPAGAKASKKVVKDPFMLAVEAYLNARAEQDELFAVTLAKPNKSLKECVDFIYSEVKKTGRQGFTDDEVYGYAVHYYDEDDIKVGSNIQKPNKVIVNTSIAAPAPVELSAEDKERARKLALDNAIAKEAQRLSTKKKAATKTLVSTEVQQSLF